jgi:hypothetical protein
MQSIIGYGLKWLVLVFNTGTGAGKITGFFSKL